MIVTDVAVIKVSPQGMILQETAPGWTAEDVQALTEPVLIVPPDLKEMTL